jgi:DNA-binding IclR family transcriptional regulator
MATLTFNSQVSVLSSKVLTYLSKRSSGVEDIAHRCCTSRDSIRVILSRLRAQNLVEHDGRRPRTWELRDEESRAA